jgi:hypothetical protein
MSKFRDTCLYSEPQVLSSEPHVSIQSQLSLSGSPVPTEPSVSIQTHLSLLRATCLFQGHLSLQSHLSLFRDTCLYSEPHVSFRVTFPTEPSVSSQTHLSLLRATCFFQGHLSLQSHLSVVRATYLYLGPPVSIQSHMPLIRATCLCSEPQDTCHYSEPHVSTQSHLSLVRATLYSETPVSIRSTCLYSEPHECDPHPPISVPCDNTSLVVFHLCLCFPNRGLPPLSPLSNASHSLAVAMFAMRTHNSGRQWPDLVWLRSKTNTIHTTLWGRGGSEK